MISSGYPCPACQHAYRQDILDMRHDDNRTILRLKCVKCETVFLVNGTGTWKTHVRRLEPDEELGAE